MQHIHTREIRVTVMETKMLWREYKQDRLFLFAQQQRSARIHMEALTLGCLH